MPTDIGVKHGDIKQGGGIGGFTKTQLPFDPAVKAAFKQAVKQHKKLKETKIVVARIDDGGGLIVLDGECEANTGRNFLPTAASVREGIHPTAPRYLLVYGGKLKRTVFIYSCPPTSQRTDRMVYATTKQTVLDAILELDSKHPPRKVEISDADDLIDGDLTGVAEKVVPVNEAVVGVKKVQTFAPGEQQGSIGALMLGLHGQKPTGKKVIRPPPGAYG
jgi:hypothetical protein